MENRIKVLFLDDNELEDEVENITRTLRRQGKVLEPYFIDISKAKYKQKIIDDGDVRVST